ncbi:hypothetical protein [Spirillospora sp. NPDC029432]|uniref:hypothetical protein n=1 Tax=Spirillospora sp. NPDC029432 TaxID=3154599 RepID=UPI003453E6E3
MRFQDRGTFGWGASGGGYADPRSGLVIHYDGANQGLAGKSHSACVSYWKATRQFHMNTRGWSDIGYCVDEETEILTEDGWKTFRDVRQGDAVLTLDHESGLSEWQPVREVLVFPAGPREMIRMEGRRHSSLTTPNHRWPVERNSGRAPRGGERGWATTGTLTGQDRIPVAAECADLPIEARWPDALVEAVAWFWTGGRAEPGTGVVIRQSEGEHAERIRTSLEKLFGAPAEDRPLWREAADGGFVDFHLTADAGAVLLERAPDRVVRFGFLRSLTRSQLALFLEVSLLAGGGTAGSRARAEALQYAATLAGKATTLRRTPAGMWDVHLDRPAAFSPHAEAARGPAFRITRERYEGHVWCVRTPNATWLARRAGTVYFTGNSFSACPHGYVMEGRGLNRQQAAQPGGNSTWYSCTLMSGPDESPTDAQVQAVRELRAWLMGKGVAGAVRGHRDFISTSCPGDRLYRLVKNGTFGKAPSEEDDMPDYVSVGMAEAQEFPPDVWVTVDWGKEYADSDHHHWDRGGPSIIEGPARYALTANVQVEGLAPGTELQARVVERDDESGNEEVGPMDEYVASGGATFVHYVVSADTVSRGARVRFQVIHYGTETGRIASGSAKGLAWRT